ncbi:hypothetical protein TNCV_3324251 [Trichonephila clavipes]|nr:hypothetical protein TNCV_3324251 [Trichonephila clavipes]
MRQGPRKALGMTKKANPRGPLSMQATTKIPPEEKASERERAGGGAGRSWYSSPFPHCPHKILIAALSLSHVWALVTSNSFAGASLPLLMPSRFHYFCSTLVLHTLPAERTDGRRGSE